MKLVFLGVGEAGDENYPNNSSLILSDTNLLLDCGFSIPPQLWRYNADQDFLDAIYISHFHADHYFGLPVLLIRMLEEKRTKPLSIICQKGTTDQLRNIIELGYRGCQRHFPFKVNYMEVDSSQPFHFNEFSLSFAPTQHTVPNLAIRVMGNSGSLCYSGDGLFNKETEELYRTSDLVIHEAFALKGPMVGHATIDQLLQMAERNQLKALALTHIQRQVRRSEKDQIDELISQSATHVFIPEPMDTIEL